MKPGKPHTLVLNACIMTKLMNKLFVTHEQKVGNSGYIWYMITTILFDLILVIYGDV